MGALSFVLLASMGMLQGWTFDCSTLFFPHYFQLGEIMKKRLKIIAIILIATLIAIWLITQPKKSIIIDVLWIPPYPEFVIDEETNPQNTNCYENIVYRIYYIWDYKQQVLPWWIITNSLDGQWRVIEAANSDYYSTYPEDNSLFTDNWIESGFKHIMRTRVQKIQHIVFGTDHKFSKEKKALRKIQSLIRVQEEFQKQGKDLYESMRVYVDSLPEIITFTPESRDSYDELFDQTKEEYLEEE